LPQVRFAVGAGHGNRQRRKAANTPNTSRGRSKTRAFKKELGFARTWSDHNGSISVKKIRRVPALAGWKLKDSAICALRHEHRRTI